MLRRDSVLQLVQRRARAIGRAGGPIDAPRRRERIGEAPLVGRTVDEQVGDGEKPGAREILEAALGIFALRIAFVDSACFFFRFLLTGADAPLERRLLRALVC